MQTVTPLTVRLIPSGNGMPLVTIDGKPFWSRKPIGGEYDAVRTIEYGTNRHPGDWPDRSDIAWLRTATTLGAIHVASGLTVLHTNAAPPNVITGYTNQRASSDDMLALLGLDPDKHIPAAGLPPRDIQGITVYVRPLDPNRNRRRKLHRVRALCPTCGKDVSAGRLFQHVVTHA